DRNVTEVQTCALPISTGHCRRRRLDSATRPEEQDRATSHDSSYSGARLAGQSPSRMQSPEATLRSVGLSRSELRPRESLRLGDRSGEDTSELQSRFDL